jgi:hypothetical protein
MTPREFSGWTPAERHLHYDADDNLTGYTVVEREARIDDGDRLDIMSLLRHDAEVCTCGYHPSIANDESNTFTPETSVCQVCGGMDLWNRVLADGDKDLHDQPAQKPRPSDGRHSYMRMLTPEQADAARAKR